MTEGLTQKIQQLIFHPLIAVYALALFLVVVSYRINATSANVILVIVWFLVAISTFYFGPFQQQPILPRVLWTGLVSCVFGLGINYWLWTTTKPAESKDLPATKGDLAHTEQKIQDYIDSKILIGDSTKEELPADLIAKAKLLLGRGDKEQQALAQIALKNPAAADRIIQELKRDPLDE